LSALPRHTATRPPRPIPETIFPKKRSHESPLGQYKSEQQPSVFEVVLQKPGNHRSRDPSLPATTPPVAEKTGQHAVAVTHANLQHPAHHSDSAQKTTGGRIRQERSLHGSACVTVAHFRGSHKDKSVAKLWAWAIPHLPPAVQSRWTAWP